MGRGKTLLEDNHFLIFVTFLSGGATFTALHPTIDGALAKATLVRVNYNCKVSFNERFSD